MTDDGSDRPSPSLPGPGAGDSSAPTDEPTLPEALALVLLDPDSGALVGEGLPLMYALGGASLVELTLRGHVELDDLGRRARAIGGPPEHVLLRPAWDRVPASGAGIRSLVVGIGTRARDRTVDHLVDHGTLRVDRGRFLGLVPTRRLRVVDGPLRDLLLDRVRAILLDGEEPDDRTAALVALLSASRSLPALHAVVPWSGEVHRRGRQLERGEWGARATAQLIVSALVVQGVGTALAGTATALAPSD